MIDRLPAVQPITLTNTVRDNYETGKFGDRMPDAKAERLLMEVSKAVGAQERRSGGAFYPPL